MTDLAKSLRDKLATRAEVRAPAIISDNTSTDGTRKWLVDVGNGNAVETVFIPEENRGTLCISTQAGCAVNCRFCSTGKQGFNRNLTVAEIIGQLWMAEFELRHTKGIEPGPKGERQITNVVMMGMGEPLLNFEPTVTALKLMLDDNAYGLSRRRVTLSTSGVVPMIDKLSQEVPVALAVSLHASNDALRDGLVPLNKKYPLRELMAACKRYLEFAPRDFITFEYCMLDGVNDSDEHARELMALVNDPRRRRVLQVQPDSVQSVPGVRPAALEKSAHQGLCPGADGCRHRDHHAQDARRRYRRRLRPAGRRSAGPHPGAASAWKKWPSTRKSSAPTSAASWRSRPDEACRRRAWRLASTADACWPACAGNAGSARRHGSRPSSRPRRTRPRARSAPRSACSWRSVITSRASTRSRSTKSSRRWRSIPDYADAYGVRALIYTSMGEIALAEENYQRALRLAPEQSGALPTTTARSCASRSTVRPRQCVISTLH